jgi:hypothetical protein
LIHYQ